MIQKTFVIAELGINHNGSIDLCKKMIESAKKNGADAVKLQIMNLDYSTSTPLFFQKKAKFSIQQYQEIKSFAEKTGIEIFSSVGDVVALKTFREVGFNKIKISSSNLRNWPLHKLIAQMQIPIILSTGESYLSEIIQVVEFYKQQSVDISLLYCVSQYPAEYDKICLQSIPYYKKIFDIDIGYSDHTIGSLSSLLAVSLGGSIIEKHFTLDKKMEGPDHHFSMDGNDLSKLVHDIRITERMLKSPTDYYFDKIDFNYSVIRRSIIFPNDKPQGYAIKLNDIYVGRPKFHTDNEIDPSDFEKIEGKILSKKINAFEPLEFSHL